MVVTLADVQADCGEIYDGLNNGTTAASRLISLAEDHINSIVGTGQLESNDIAVRWMADSLICQQMMGSVDPVSKTVGNLNIGAKELKDMRDRFFEMTKQSLKIKGYSTDGLSVRIEMVNT